MQKPEMCSMCGGTGKNQPGGYLYTGESYGIAIADEHGDYGTCFKCRGSGWTCGGEPFQFPAHAIGGQRDYRHVSISRQSGPQCGYVGYMEAIDANKHRVPTHVHTDEHGRFIERAWGAAAECTHPRGTRAA